MRRRPARRRNVARCRDGASPASSSVPSETLCVFPIRQAPHTQLSISQADHSLYPSRHAVAAQRSARVNGQGSAGQWLSHQRAFHIHGAPPAYRAVISRHPEAAQMSLLAGLVPCSNPSGGPRSRHKPLYIRQQSPVHSQAYRFPLGASDTSVSLPRALSRTRHLPVLSAWSAPPTWGGAPGTGVVNVVDFVDFVDLADVRQVGISTSTKTGISTSEFYNTWDGRGRRNGQRP